MGLGAQGESNPALAKEGPRLAAAIQHIGRTQTRCRGDEEEEATLHLGVRADLTEEVTSPKR
jgi:hypothetical protein